MRHSKRLLWIGRPASRRRDVAQEIKENMMTKRTTTPIALAWLLGAGLALSACANTGEVVEEGGGGPIGTEMQPTASPGEVQDEAPMQPEFLEGQ